MSEASGKMPRTWAVATLGDLGDYVNGRAFKAEDWGTAGLPIIRIQDLTGSRASPNHYNGQVEERHRVEHGDLLVSWAATLGAYLWQGPSAVLNQHIFKVHTRVEKSFHYYVLKRIVDDLYRQAHGSGMVHVTKGTFERAPVFLPPLREQRRIVEALDSYFSRLAEAEAALERVQRHLKRYRAAVLQAAVDGRLVPTEAELARAEGRDYEPASELLKRILVERRRRWEEAELARLKATGRVPKDDKWKGKYQEPVQPAEALQLPQGWVWVTVDTVRWDAGYGTSQKCTTEAQGPPVLRIPNVSNQTVSLDNLKYATDPAGLQPKEALEPGDFLFIRTNGSQDLIGRGALVPSGFPTDHYFASYLIRLRLVAVGVLPQWAALVWHSGVIRRQVLAGAASSAGQYNVSLAAATRFTIPLPPLAEQRRILDEVARVSSVSEASASTIFKSLERCARLRQSILKWAFEGKLVNQDPNDEPAAVLLERIRAERAARADSSSTRPRKRQTRGPERGPAEP